jgi:hypothetical protein
VGNTLHQAAIPQENIGKVVDYVVSRAIELGPESTLGNRHADRVGNALAERSGGGFNAGRVAVLRVPRGPAVQLAEVLQLLDRQVVTGQVQQGVDEHRAVAVGQHEAVAIGPGGVRRVVAEEIVPQHLRYVRHAHRRAGMATVGLLDRVHGQGADRICQVSSARHAVAPVLPRGPGIVDEGRAADNEPI